MKKINLGKIWKSFNRKVKSEKEKEREIKEYWLIELAKMRKDLELIKDQLALMKAYKETNLEDNVEQHEG